MLTSMSSKNNKTSEQLKTMCLWDKCGCAFAPSVIQQVRVLRIQTERHRRLSSGHRRENDHIWIPESRAGEEPGLEGDKGQEKKRMVNCSGSS